MAPVVEVMFAPATEAYRDDHSTMFPVMDIVSASKGCLGIYYGIGVEDPNLLAHIVVWETLADHQAQIDDNVRYPKLLEAFTASGDITKVEMFHVYLEPKESVAAVFDSPYTSYSHVLTRKPDKAAVELDALLGTLAGLTDVEGSSGGVWGRVLEKDEHILLYGWEDPKYHIEGRKRDPPASVLAKIHETVEEYKSGHVKLRAYKKYER